MTTEKPKKHSHEFVESYGGLVGFGLDRETDEATVIWCVQKLSDDRLMTHLVKRMSDEELEALFDTVMATLKRHLSEVEYHELFLKDRE